MNIIPLVSGAIYFSIVIFNWFLPYVTQKNIQFGVRIPREKEADPAIDSIRKKFHLMLAVGVSIIFLMTYVLPFLLGYYTFVVFSIVFESLYTHINYYLAFRRLHSIKVLQKWYDGVDEALGVVFSDEPSLRRAIASIYFIFPSIMLLVAAIVIGVTGYPSFGNMIPSSFGSSGIPVRYVPKTVINVFSFTIIQAAIVALLFTIGCVITRTRQEIDSSRPYTTFEQQTRFKTFYRDIFYTYSAFWGITLLLVSLRRWEYPTVDFPLVLEFLPVLAGMILLVTAPYLIGQMGSRLQVAGSGSEYSGSSGVDDDREWKGGIFYFNHNDPSTLVGRRFGIGWTLNLANPRSWIFIGLVVAGLTFVLIHRIH